jgi:GT2 family glycosyltransferase/glycosyltransferase involved in cell wall biosynthesis
VEVLEAREDATVPVGAAAVINAGLARATGDFLLVVEAGCAWDKPLLADLMSAVWRADVLAVAVPGTGGSRSDAAESRGHAYGWNDAWVPHALPVRGDVLSLVQQACGIPLAEWAAQLHASRPRLWAIRRDTLRALAGLEPALWHVGLVEDLADRAHAQGIGVQTFIAPTPTADPHDAWPVRPHVLQFLALRNALLSAAFSQTPSRSGRALAVLASLGLADAWRQTGIAAERLRFGGSWGAPRRWRAVRSGMASEHLWPAHEAGAVLPVLALDAFLDALITRLATPGRVPITQATAPDADESVSPPGVPAAAPGGAPLSPPLPAGAPTDRTPLPFLSVVVVNWNGRQHLADCFSSLEASDYPADRREIICVDNGSTDGSRELLASRFPAVRVVALPQNRGFTGGNAAGVAAAHGDVLAFFNNDMRVDVGALRALVAALDADHPCVAAQVRSWNGRYIDFVRGSVNFEAHGFQEHYGERWRPERVAATQTFFPNGGAFAVTRVAYERAGGFDETFFAYYDDVDLGFGIRMNGGRIRVVPEAVVYHRHGATSRRHPRGQKRFLMERNSLWTAMKRYEDATLDRALGALLLLAARRIAQQTVLQRRAPWVRALAPLSARCRRRAAAAPAANAALVYVTERSADPPAGPGGLTDMPVEALAAVGEALRGLREVRASRQVAQRERIVPDRVVFTEMGRPLAYGAPLESYQAAHDALVQVLRLARVFQGRPRLLIVTHEPLRKRLSGPGVRALEMARALAPVARVTLATPADPEMSDPACAITRYAVERPQTLRRLAEDADILLVQGFTLTQFPFLTGMHVPIVVDLYCPFTVEFLEMKTAEARARGAVPDLDAQLEAVRVLEVQNAQLRHGDFFLCASERQRDFWLGALHGIGRVNAPTYASDPSLRALVAVVPFGVPQEDFDAAAARATQEAGGPVLKGARPGIGRGDRVLFWGGSLLDWQDPLTLIRAVARLARVRSDIRLFFAGTRHPNPHVAPMRVVESSIALARDLGMLDTHVFFNDWIPYEQRAAYLREADLGLSTHRLHLETHLSFRTRMLDYIWAALPIVCTEGDHFADLVRVRGLGLVVRPDDEEALAAAIGRLLDDAALRESCRRGLAVLREELRWPRVTEPLRRFVASPHFAADHEPAMRAIRAKLRTSYRISKWIKRTALRMGVSEGRFEHFKALPPVQVAIRARNRLALSRAGRLRRPA